MIKQQNHVTKTLELIFNETEALMETLHERTSLISDPSGIFAERHSHFQTGHDELDNSVCGLVSWNPV